jgi:hypothetical protein
MLHISQTFVHYHIAVQVALLLPRHGFMHPCYYRIGNCNVLGKNDLRWDTT